MKSTERNTLVEYSDGVLAEVHSREAVLKGICPVDSDVSLRYRQESVGSPENGWYSKLVLSCLGWDSFSYSAQIYFTGVIFLKEQLEKIEALAKQ